jgi:hypothetical protein
MDADQTRRVILDPLFASRDYEQWFEQSLWVVSIFEQAGAHDYAENHLKAFLRIIAHEELESLRPQVEHALRERGMEPP